ncbi:MAG: phage integrase N-terminal SAM-like domain-containing protein [Natronomonas sp.]|uniref:tyrosine-type recombinase/integrase n=1 Tax=Natronomonas sp. TaxID=2184060 RepID=UPI002870A544|nr:site-specific integrase [Natronomonas sp.]MDR9380715.1 phage integrase N-terminal SAM-like domain-containing protein [Natronomonas sp.]MDR9431524.1 phage integrase N-terminal SAM-like domain-containing protein [Natronomonas sp.]
MSDDRHTDPGALTVREAVQRYLRRQRRDKAESTVRTYRLDLRQFVLWCEAEDIERVGELSPMDLELYQDDRAADLAPTSLENQIGLVKRFLEFCEDLGAATEGLADTVAVPRADAIDQSRDDKLETADAVDLLVHFRDADNGLFGTKWHALLEVAWHTGARLGGLRGLDLGDYDADFQVLEFRHRPRQGTPLKNKLDGERDVAILPEVASALDAYIDEHRFDRHDEHGRAPLFTTRSAQGRLSPSAVRNWLYQATQPCWHTDNPCPHEKVRQHCEWTQSTKASQCPSARSPHAVRTGSITFHRDRGFDPQDTAERVNASLRTIEKHYDKASRRDRMEKRRRPQLDKLSLDDES